ncbi:MAG TPA: hypothetical protein EYP63_07040 [Desulfotomaculum sp.]|nr:hypothetical protein [Desulfotomaculum sp.]
MGEKERRRHVTPRVTLIRFTYPLSNRYYLLSESSGYPSADYQVPFRGAGETRLIIREVDR